MLKFKLKEEGESVLAELSIDYDGLYLSIGEYNILRISKEGKLFLIPDIDEGEGFQVDLEGKILIGERD